MTSRAWSNGPGGVPAGWTDLHAWQAWQASLTFTRAVASIDSAQLRGEMDTGDAEQARASAHADWLRDWARLRELYPSAMEDSEQ